MTEKNALLFELGTEELPPVALKTLSDSLTTGFVEGLDTANLSHGKVRSFAAPRRLAVYVEEVSARQPDRDLEKRGPAVAAAFDAEGNPTKAAEGFARSCGTTVDQLSRQHTEKGEWLVYHVRESGKAAIELLPEIAEKALAKLPIPKRMRWGASEAQFVRPVHWLLFMLGEQVVPCTILDAKADNLTFGHRFHHPAAITVYNPEDYEQVLGGLGKVIANFEVRKHKIREQVKQTAAAIGGHADIDEDLLDEVTALNEWPVPIAGTFEETFLEVPSEALVTTMKSNQKYFPVFDASQRLMNHFITIANIDSPKPEIIKEGNERVVRPRLADAKFFWEQDGRRKLEDHVESLKKVVFQKQLGSMYEKSVRVAELAKFIASAMGVDSALAYRAGLLSRCDLMTEMVYEFPSMQGIMGRYQAARDGEAEELATALDEFYMPRFSGDELPRTRTGIAVALAERIDTLIGIFGIGMKPTGDKDPFALRRAALGALRIMRERSLTIDLHDLLRKAQVALSDKTTASTVDEVFGFMLERLKGIYLEEGVSADIFEAVALVKPTSLVDFDDRVRAVIEFGKLEEAAALAAANKRIRNILKKAESVPEVFDTGLMTEPAEKHLADQLGAIRKETAPMMANSDYGLALHTMTSLRPAVDDFFDNVMVMADDARIRDNRLALLKGLSQLFLQVGDISVLQS